MTPNAILTVLIVMGVMGLGFGATTMDMDSDGIANCEGPDNDADGINDTFDEYPFDHDNDGIPDFRDDDDDNDGIPDAEDDGYVANCTKPERTSKDLDSDGIPDCEDSDDDGDGINDTQDEYPHDHDNDGIPDMKDDDDDNDGIPDAEDEEYVGNCSKPMHRFRKGHRRFPPKDGQNKEEDKESMGFKRLRSERRK
jgi:hypothetical protein